jgi:GNAT superfamily N-acetyltransferase
MTPIIIRPAGSALDKEQCFDLRRSVLCGELHLGREAGRDPFDDEAQHRLAWDGDKPVGTGRLLRRGSHWVIEHLAILPGYRRQGLGRRLLAELVQAARREQAARLLALGPLGALPFLQACGFELESQDDGVVLTTLSVS